MNVYEAIQGRYSVRSYKSEKVEEEKLRRILDAGRIAPSGNNRQGWKFIVVRDPEVIKALVDASGQSFIGEAPVVIAIVSTNEHIMSCQVPQGPVDCAIAIDHMTLAAVEEGLGTCWIGHFDQERAKKALSVPESAQIIELLPLGYPNVRTKKKVRKALEEVVCYDQFE